VVTATVGRDRDTVTTKMMIAARETVIVTVTVTALGWMLLAWAGAGPP
jgi:hypothetical protein